MKPLVKKKHPKIPTELVLKEGLPWWGVHLHKNVKGGLNKKTAKRGWSLVWGFTVLHCIVLYFVVFLQSTIIDLTTEQFLMLHMSMIIALYFVFCVVSLFYSVVLRFVVRCIPTVCCVSPKHTQRLPTEQFQMYIVLYFLHWNYYYVVWYYTFPCHDPAKHCQWSGHTTFEKILHSLCYCTFLCSAAAMKWSQNSLQCM